MVETVSRVVRKMGSEIIHVVNVAPSDFVMDSFLSHPYVGVAPPVVTVCGVELRSWADRAPVCMAAGTKVSCSRCRRLSGVVRAAEDNALDPSGRVQV